MSRLLVLLVLAQDLSFSGTSLERTAPVQAYDEGIRQGRVIGVDCRGAGVTCVRDGGYLFVTIPGGGGGAGGKVAESYMADASITAQVANVAYSADASYQSQLSGTANVAYSADASFYSNQFITNPTDCGGGQFANAIDSSGNLSCATPAGGSGNSGIDFVVFYGDAGTSVVDSAEQTVSASWVTATSSIVFTPACSQVTGGVTAQ